MAFDGIYLYSIVNELKNSILNCKIDKISQPEKDEIILTLRKDRKNIKLLISSSSRFPRIGLTTVQKENPLKAPMFLMVLRKYLTSGKIINISQFKGDRIVTLHIEAADEMGFNSEYSLIVEIMGRHSNITLVRDRDNKIIDCIKHITPDINSYRVLLPGVTYVYPPSSDKLVIDSFTEEDLVAYIKEKNITIDDNLFSKVFVGISKPLSKELFFRLTNLQPNIDNIYYIAKELNNELSSRKSYNIYLKDNMIKDFHSIELSYLKDDFKVIKFQTPWEQMDTYFSEKDKADRLHSKSSSLQKFINTNLDRCLKKSKILNQTIENCEDKEKYKIIGDILSANIYTLKERMSEVTLQNFYSEDFEEIKIILDPSKTPSQNIQSYYKKYNKAKKSEEGALEQLEKNENEIEYLNSVLTNLLNCENYSDIDDIKTELIESNYLKYKKSNKKGQKPSKPLKFTSSEGIPIYVGKNNLQNEYLSLKFANKNFIWFHTKGIPGSHVILCTDELLDKSIEEAASLAAYYSKARNGSKVPVDYTYVKNLKKPSGSKPGMVIYHTNWSMFVDPKLI